jgi:hypothetical protein
VSGLPLLLPLLHRHHDSQPLFLLAGFLSFHQVCKISNYSAQLRQCLILLRCRSLHAANSATGRRRSMAPHSPFAVLVYVHRVKYGCARLLEGDECCPGYDLHRQIHTRIAPPISSLSCI